MRSQKKVVLIALAFVAIVAIMGGTANAGETEAYQFLTDMMDRYYTGDDLRIIQSYAGADPMPDPDMDTLWAWVYDAAVVVTAGFMARGTVDDLNRAKVLCDAFIYAQDHDVYFTDNRIRTGYYAKDWIDPTNGKTWYCGPDSHVGPTAWVILALMHYYQAEGDTTYLGAAKRFAHWIVDNTYDTRGAGGYTGGWQGWEPNQTKIMWKSTEMNLDVYVAFMLLYESTGDTYWLDKSLWARGFLETMWDPTQKYFYCGTGDDGVTPNTVKAIDNQTWPILIFGDINGYGDVMTCVETDFKTTSDGFTGVDFNTDKDGVFFAGTAHSALAYQVLGETAKSDAFVSEVARAQTEGLRNNGKGIINASHDWVTTLWDGHIHALLHIEDTAWYIAALRKFNPFWGISTSDPIPYKVFCYVEYVNPTGYKNDGMPYWNIGETMNYKLHLRNVSDDALSGLQVQAIQEYNEEAEPALDDLMVDDFSSWSQYNNHQNDLGYWTGYGQLGSGGYTVVHESVGKLEICWQSTSAWWSSVIGVSPSYVDGNSYSAVSFDAKGMSGGEQFSVRLTDSAIRWATVPLSNYMPSGLTTDYTTITIPISDFVDANPSLDVSHLKEINLVDFVGTGTIRIDNLKLDAGTSSQLPGASGTTWENQSIPAGGELVLSGSYYIVPETMPGVDRTHVKVTNSSGNLIYDKKQGGLWCPPEEVMAISAYSESDMPVSFELSQNYPNPFNPTTCINYYLPKNTYVRLEIFNVLGQSVRTLVNGYRYAGAYKIMWDGKDYNGKEVPGGIYFYRISAGDFIQTKKMTMLK